MRPASLTVFLFTFLLVACLPQPADHGQPTADLRPVTVTPTPLPPSPSPTNDYPDKFSLWTNGAQLRGANIWQRIRVPDLDGDLLGDGYIGPPNAQSDFDRLAALGANYVNLSIPGLFSERPPYVLDEGAQANLDSLLEMAARAGLFAVISFRTGPGRSDFTFYRDGAGEWFDPSLLIETVWTEQAAQDAWVEMWRYTAERYRANPIVVGYDLMVEPNADEVMLDLYDPADFYPRYAGTLYDWNQFHPRLVTAIRSVDTGTPILVNPMGWGSIPWLSALRPVQDERVVYAVHQYGPFQYTHQQPDDRRPYPGDFDVTWDNVPDRFDRDWLLNWLAPILAFREQTGAPVAVNEFGVVRWAPGAADFLRDEIEFFEQNGLNHALWVWEPTYEPWRTSVDIDHAMFYPFGPDPNNLQDVENDLMNVILESWRKNTLRPSSPSSSSPTASFTPTPSCWRPSSRAARASCSTCRRSLPKPVFKCGWDGWTTHDSLEAQQAWMQDNARYFSGQLPGGESRYEQKIYPQGRNVLYEQAGTQPFPADGRPALHRLGHEQRLSQCPQRRLLAGKSPAGEHSTGRLSPCRRSGVWLAPWSTTSRWSLAAACPNRITTTTAFCTSTFGASPARPRRALPPSPMRASSTTSTSRRPTATTKPAFTTLPPSCSPC